MFTLCLCGDPACSRWRLHGTEISLSTLSIPSLYLSYTFLIWQRSRTTTAKQITFQNALSNLPTSVSMWTMNTTFLRFSTSIQSRAEFALESLLFLLNLHTTIICKLQDVPGYSSPFQDSCLWSSWSLTHWDFTSYSSLLEVGFYLLFEVGLWCRQAWVY